MLEKANREQVATNNALQQEIEERRRAQLQLQQFNKFAVGREIRMIELKHEVNELLVARGEKERYDVSQLQTTSVS